MIIVRAFKDPVWVGDSIKLAVLEVDPFDKRKVSIATNFSFETIDPTGAVDNSKLISIGADGGQKLMDELWDCGLRPSEGSGSAGAMAATQRHLEDMRALVFKKNG